MKCLVCLAVLQFLGFFPDFFLVKKFCQEEKNDVAELVVDKKFKIYLSPNVISGFQVGVKELVLPKNKILLSVYGVSFNPSQVGDDLKAEKIAILKAKSQLIGYIDGSKII